MDSSPGLVDLETQVICNIVQGSAQKASPAIEDTYRKPTKRRDQSGSTIEDRVRRSRSCG
jgi:hypothetical protein